MVILLIYAYIAIMWQSLCSLQNGSPCALKDVPQGPNEDNIIFHTNSPISLSYSLIFLLGLYSLFLSPESSISPSHSITNDRGPFTQYIMSNFHKKKYKAYSKAKKHFEEMASWESDSGRTWMLEVLERKF